MYDLDTKTGEDGRPSSATARADAKALRSWAERTGVKLEDAKRLQTWFGLHHRVAGKEANGDPHPLVVNREDKRANAAAWGALVESAIRQINRILRPYNMTYVQTGLWGSIKRDGRFIEDLPARS